MPRFAIQNSPNSVQWTDFSSRINMGTGGPYTGNISVGGWVFHTNIGGSNTIASKRNSYAIGDNAWHLIVGASLNLRLAYGNSVSELNSKIVNGQWTHVVWVHDVANSLERIYIDGIQTSTVPLKTLSGVANNNLWFGNTSLGTTEAWSGWQKDMFIYGSALSAQQVSDICFKRIFPSGAYCILPLDEGSGATARDISGNGNNGTLQNTNWSTNTPHTPRAATSSRVAVQDLKSSLFFNGSSTVINATAITGLSAGFTFFCWLNPRGVGSNNLLAANFVSSSDRGAFSIGNDGSIRGTYNNGSNVGSASSAAGKITYGVWQPIAYTFNGSSGKVYVNGADVTVGSSAGNLPGSGALQIGGFAFLKGFVSNFMLFNRALAVNEVVALSSGILPADTSTSLKTKFGLTEGAGTTAYDISGNANNGTISNGTFTSDVPTKKRQLVGGNMVYNGDFEYAPPVNVATTSNGHYIDGTASGSSTNTLFGWALDQVSTGSNATLFDTTLPHSGTYSLKVSTTATSSSADVSPVNSFNRAGENTYGIPVLPNTSYTATFWMKTNYVSGSATSGAYAQFQEWDGNNGSGASNQSTKVTATTAWTKYTVTFTTASTTRIITPRLIVKGSDGTGTLIMDAWYDSIELYPTVNTTRGVVS